MDLNTIPWQHRAPLKIAIIGDVILDEYLIGSVSRVSPEAPVPVVEIQTTRYSPGGAANVAVNIQNCGGHIQLLSVCGDDEPAQTLTDLLKKNHIGTRDILRDASRPTIKKTRISGAQQQLLRVDWEKRHNISKQHQEQLFESLKGAHVNAILISDYGKGCLEKSFLQKIIAYGKSQNIPVVVDPKGLDYDKYTGATLITPNHNEAMQCLNIDPKDNTPAKDMAHGIRERFGIENVVITLGSKGMLAACNQSGNPTTIELKATAREVYDVSGAGDTVVALMTLGLASGISFEHSMYIANTGAGLVVEKWGTQPINTFELEQALQSKHSSKNQPSCQKLTTPEHITSLYGEPEQRTKKIVFTNGCFDILHSGHVSYLEQAKKLGDVLVIGLNTDESIKRLKGDSRPINSLLNRQIVLAGLSCVDWIIPFEDNTPSQLIQAVKPDFLIKGADWEAKDIIGHDFVKSYGGEVKTIELVPNQSTTGIIDHIKRTH